MAIATKEFTVIATVAEELSTLDKGGIRRALDWLADYFDVYDEAGAIIAPTAPIAAIEFAEAAEDWAEDDVAEDEAEDASSEPETFADFYALIAPKTAIQKAVTAAYWLQNNDGLMSWKSFEVNKLLRQNDVKLSSISGTLALDEKKDVPMVQQVARSGDSMQSRKTFVLSDAGVAFVEGRM